MPGSPSVACEAGWPDSAVEAFASRRRARSVPGSSLSITPRDHNEVPQLVARTPHLRRTYRALCRSRFSIWRLASPLLKGSGTAPLSTDFTSVQSEPSGETCTTNVFAYPRSQVRSTRSKACVEPRSTRIHWSSS